MSSHYADTARQQAEHILSRPPFASAPKTSPGLLSGVLHWMGRALKFIFGGFFSWIFHHVLVHVGHGFTFVFGNWWPVAAAVLAVGVGVATAMILARRRARVEGRVGAASLAVDVDLDEEQLRQLAAAATAAGDFESAVRLLFRWGVRRLSDVGAVANGPAKTDSQLTGALRSASFADVQRRHERIVYGRVEATRDDVDASTAGWERVLRESRSSSRRDSVDL